MNMANIKDVAKEAGVGIATVSRVINNSGYVKKETRAKIEKVIEELEYRPNEIARSMTKQKNDIVAFVLPNTTHLFFGELVHFVENALFEYGYKLLVCNSSEKIEKEISYLDMLKNNRVDALILLTNNKIEHFLRKGLPIISFDRKFEDFPYVASDNYTGGKMAADHLIDKGCEHIMFVGDDAQGDSTTVITDVSNRRRGFLDQAAARGFKNITNIEYPLGDYVKIPDFVFEEINNNEEVDGIFCISDAVAAEVIIRLEANGRKVPEDVKVMGYDGGRSFINLGKKLTSISQDSERIAASIVSLVNAYYNKEEVRNIIVPVSFSEGETT